MKVCYFGNYNPRYSRNRINIRGLRENGVEVLECNNRSHGIMKYIKLFFKHLKIRKDYDVMIVGFPGHTTMLLAKLITRKPIVFDVFISMYDTCVFDRRTCERNSLRAKYYYFLDGFTCKLADKLLIDTNEHIKYFVKEFGIEKQKFLRVLVSAEDEVMYPREVKKETDKFLVHFHGNGIPLQGVEYILKAARILENEEIEFNMIGKLEGELKIELPNVNYLGHVNFEKLSDYINQADIVLGIFGNTAKAKRVIPNKVYEAIACAKPIITSDTPGIHELFTNKKNCLLCNTSDPKDLADKILLLKNDKELRDKIAMGGYELFKTVKSKEVTKELVQVMQALV